MQKCPMLRTVFGDTPNNKPIIENIEIDTFGIEYVLTDDNKIN